MQALITPGQSIPPIESGLFSRTWWMFLNNLRDYAMTAFGLVLYGTHGERLALKVSGVSSGAVFIETDRDNLQYQMRGGAWKHAGGIYRRTQVQLAALAATLTADDNGLLVRVTDHDHMLEWTNPAWGWGPGDSRNAGQAGMFDADPGAGWKLCDGTGDDGAAIGVAHPIKVLQADGTTRDITALDDLTAGLYPKFGAAFTGAAVAAVPPGITGDTADESAHSHGIDHDHAAVASGTPSPTTVVQAGAGATVAASNHNHMVDVDAFVGPSGTGSAHKHGVGTLAADATGEPAHMVWLPYLRK